MNRSHGIASILAACAALLSPGDHALAAEADQGGVRRRQLVEPSRDRDAEQRGEDQAFVNRDIRKWRQAVEDSGAKPN